MVGYDHWETEQLSQYKMVGPASWWSAVLESSPSRMSSVISLFGSSY